MKHFEKVHERTVNPLTLARQIVREKGIPEELREPHAITDDIIRLHSALSPRWEKFKEYQLWENAGHKGSHPTFEDHETGELRSGKYALAPCTLLNESLNELVGLTLKVYTPEKLRQIMELTKSNPETAHAVKELRQIAIHAEEAMEQEALSLIFKAVEANSYTYKTTIEDIVRQKYQIAQSDSIPNTPEMKTALLEALVFNFPKKLQEAQPEEYKGMVFKYFDNYPTLVASELELLTTPFMLQNEQAPYFYGNIVDMLDANPAIVKALSAISSKYTSGVEAEKAVEDFIDNFPEMFGVQNLSQKTFTFVGAGFPLTGLLQHIQTGGATINLIDYDEAAVEAARKLIAITESLGITKRDAIQVIHADARDVTYVPLRNVNHEHPLHEMEYVGRQKYTVATDILDLASALPKDVTDHVMQVNAAAVPIVRKRNVSGISELLYEKFNLPPESIFRLAGHVTPAQKLLSGASPEHLVTGVMSPINVNSDDVYVNTSRFREKSEFLISIGKETISDTVTLSINQPEAQGKEEGAHLTNQYEVPDTRVLSAGSVQWNERTMAYYRY